MVRCTLYLRVSSEEQNAENQLPAREAWVQSRGHEIVGIYQYLYHLPISPRPVSTQPLGEYESGTVKVFSVGSVH